MDTTTSPNRPLRIAGFLTAGLPVIIGLWLTGITADTAVAQTAPDYKASESVSYADLDLSTNDGARTLLRRIDFAAKRVCGPEPSHSPLQPHLTAFYQRCVRDSVDSTVDAIGSPLLSAMNGEQKTAGAAALASR
ncbi:MAG TPA: UrcA family protein [Hyphomonadaceae bacterium]|nr:UrcA family protein [Hyphomonadaceae bacterium]